MLSIPTLLILIPALPLAAALVTATLGPALIGVIRRRRLRLLPLLPVLPFYYLLVSAAAWCALRELFTDAYGWHKTPHGTGNRKSRQVLPRP